MAGDNYVTCNLEDILVGEPLPVNLYVYIDFRFITFRSAGDVIDRNAYDRLEFKKVRNLFMLEKDHPKFEKWVLPRAAEISAPLPPEQKEFAIAREDLHRKTMDIFHSSHPDKIVEQTLNSSKRMVVEVMKLPYASQSLAQLQTYSKGTVDHSVNVSVLSVYLAMQMGYSHHLILQHVGMGGLLHDIGKSKVPISDEDSKEVIDKKLEAHPSLGAKFLENLERVPNEVKMIVEQHHEQHDAAGYPKKLRGSQIYDLARIVSIANVFDGLVGDGKGSLIERQRNAVIQLDQIHYKKFDPQKLEKVLKILKLGI